MYCKNCGQFLTGNENFCSNCGAKVEAPAAPKTFPAFTPDKGMTGTGEKATEKKESVKVMSPVDDIVWDVKEFPTGEPKKTDDTEIRWRSEDMFLHKEIQREQEAFEKSMAEFMSGSSGTDESSKDDGLEILDVFKDHGAREQAKNRNEEDKTVVTRNTAPVMTELQTDDRIVDIEQPSGSGIAIEVVDSGDNGVKVEKVIVDEPQMTSVIADTEELDSEKQEPVSEAEISYQEEETTEEKSSEPDKDESSEKIAAAAAGVAAGVVGTEALGKAGSLFDEIAPKAVETLTGANINEEKKQIDKFYTFNRKKEEFQKLLDKEYERIENKLEPGGFEEDIAGFMDVERGTAVEGTTQLEEMVKARTLFFDDPFFVPEDDKEEKEEEQAVAEALADDEGGIPAEELEGTKSKVVFEPQAEESLADVLAEQEKAEDLDESAEEEASPVETEAKADEDKKPAEEKSEEAAEAEKEEAKEVKEATSEEETEEKEDKEDKSDEAARIVIEPNVKPEEKDDDTEKLAREFFESDDDDEKKKMGKGSKILIWILSIIIVITAALLVVRIALPDTVISRQMDNIAYKVVSLFTGEDEDADADASAGRDSLVEDKTGLIQLQIDKNYKDGIATIKYNADAAYDENKDYAKDTGLNDAKDIQSNLWYTDDSGNSHYYDEELVGAVIAFESQRLALINDADNKVMSMVEKSSSIEDQLKEEAGSDKDIDFSQLEIGDIKVAGNSYFVWVNETIDGKQSQKIYEFREKDKSLVVRAAYDA
ncbi:MAG TPA: zinc ribbon domain-containing protein [Candidatus Eubacterium pullicola]|nr:zinc ribbon domain-containing protein [Candidatus Eubacterium pullicola]